MRVGIVGGGQLGRMLAIAGYPLDIRCTTLDPARDSPASQVAPSIVGPYDDREALARLAEGADVVTYEFENVPVDAARFLMELAPVFPPAEALEIAQDRVRRRRSSTTCACRPRRMKRWRRRTSSVQRWNGWGRRRC